MRVLIAVESKEFAAAIKDFIAAHQWSAGTIFKVLHVVELPLIGDSISSIYGNGIQNEILRERVDIGEQLVGWVREQLEERLGLNTPIETDTILGAPHPVILQTAHDWRAEMIVLGAQGRSDFSRFMLGSVSLAVVSHAECSVVIVHLPTGHESVRAPIANSADNVTLPLPIPEIRVP